MAKKVLTIGGSDSWGGGGIQTDLKTFEDHGVFGLSVLTCVAVSQNEDFVIRQLPLELIREQLNTINTSFELDALKIGLLSTIETVAVVEDFCRQLPENIPIILDPVLAFKETSQQYQREYAEALLKLGENVTIMTPNLIEAHLLADNASSETLADLKITAETIFHKTNTPVVIKGGSRFPASQAIDFYYDGEKTEVLAGPRSTKVTTNGAGCCFSAAICSHLAQGEEMMASLISSKKFVYEAIENGVPVTEVDGDVWHPQKSWRIVSHEFTEEFC